MNQRKDQNGHSDWTANEIERRVLDIGFDVCGFTTPEAIPKAENGLRTFLNNHWHGSMDWMARNAERRARPDVLWPETKSIIVAGMNYGPENDPMASLALKQRAAISVYAQGRDYHDVLKKKLKSIARWINSEFGAEVKVFVDTAPVMEKPLAAAAGIGWQGKHSNLVSKQLGSWFFLGSIFTTLELPPREPHRDNCGSCQSCLNICPTNAFPAPYKLDATRCISYLTIEHKKHIPVEFRKPIGNRIYGCDDCLAVCPWNKFAQSAKLNDLQARKDLTAPPLRELAALDDARFREFFSGTAIKRTGRDRFVRNVLIAIGNSEDSTLLDVAERALSDLSPLVRAMAVWACGQLASREHLANLFASHNPSETDSDVLDEWQKLLTAE